MILLAMRAVWTSTRSIGNPHDWIYQTKATLNVQNSSGEKKENPIEAFSFPLNGQLSLAQVR